MLIFVKNNNILFNLFKYLTDVFDLFIFVINLWVIVDYYNILVNDNSKYVDINK